MPSSILLFCVFHGFAKTPDITVNSRQKERLMNNGGKTLTFLIMAAFPFILIAIFHHIDHIMKGGLGGF